MIALFGSFTKRHTHQLVGLNQLGQGRTALSMHKGQSSRASSQLS